MKIQEDYLINLVIDYSKGNLSNEQKIQLEGFLNENPENKKTFNHFRRLYYNGRSIAFNDQLDQEQAWSCIAKGLKKPKAKVRKLHLWLPYAAAAVIVLTLVSTFFLLREVEDVDFSKDYNFAELAHTGSKKATLTLADGSKVKLHEEKEQKLLEKDGTQITKDSANNITYIAAATETELLYNTIDVPRGGEYSLTLSDGTQVWLNADTELRYPVKFQNNKRDVYLVGEAYFEVAHNKQAPFVVHSHDSEVKVLGTKFNISSYEDQEFIATTLIEGSVQVQYLEGAEILEPGFQSNIIRGQNAIQVKEVDTNLYTSWIDGVYEFEDMELDYIMTQLGRWYNVDFFFMEERYKHIRFTGAIKRENDFNYALRMIERVANVEFTIKDKRVIVGRQF